MVGVWMQIWGIPLPGDSADPTEGSFIDRWFYLCLIGIGLYILNKRKLDWSAIRSENSSLFVLLVFMVISTTWSDFPMVSFKRFIKVVGACVMALVVLTEPNRFEAIIAVIRRCAYIHIPMSIITIRYFRDIGLSYDWSGSSAAWQGISTSKNTLGQVAMTSALCFIWECLRHPRKKEGRKIDYLYILMSLYLLKGSDSEWSLTSVSVFLLGLLVLFVLQRLKNTPAKAVLFFKYVCSFIICILSIVIVHACVNFNEDSVMGLVIKTLGRDMTLTGRTEIWSDVFDVAARNPLLGVGYGGFWIGRLANIPWTEKLTWTLAQAHNGYVDMYLQIGWIGVILFAVLVISTIGKLARAFQADKVYGQFCMTFFIIILYVNITESTLLRGDHNQWFLFLLTILVVPQSPKVAEEAVDVAIEPEQVDAVLHASLAITRV